jgi:hypothetical protein
MGNFLEMEEQIPKTVYRHLSRGYLSACAGDFPRAVKFKERRRHKQDDIPKAVENCRTYNDFLSHTEENEISSWVVDIVNLIFSHVNSIHSME